VGLVETSTQPDRDRKEHDDEIHAEREVVAQAVRNRGKRQASEDSSDGRNIDAYDARRAAFAAV